MSSRALALGDVDVAALCLLGAVNVLFLDQHLYAFLDCADFRNKPRLCLVDSSSDSRVIKRRRCRRRRRRRNERTRKQVTHAWSAPEKRYIN